MASAKATDPVKKRLDKLVNREGRWWRRVVLGLEELPCVGQLASADYPDLMYGDCSQGASGKQ